MWKKIAVGCAVSAVLGLGGYLLYRHIKSRREASKPISEEYVKYDKNRSTEKHDDNNKDWDNKHLPNKDIYAERLRKYNGDKNFESYMAEMESPEEEFDEEQEEEDDEEDPFDGIDIDIPGENEAAKTKPYPIDADTYMNTRTFYEKLDYDYYIQDKVLLDDAGDPISLPERYVGNLCELISGEDIPNTIYIRNEAMETDFAVALFDSSYRKDILKDDSGASGE